jgi:ABC-type oligopeptide transport system substrate-binding subunit
MDVVDQPWPEFTQRLSQRDLPGFVLTWVADFPDPENVLATLLRTGSPDNYLGYSNLSFDRLVQAANAETDVQRRRELYLEAQQLAIDDAVIIPLYHEMSYTLVQPWVRGLVVTEIGILALEDVWIED